MARKIPRVVGDIEDERRYYINLAVNNIKLEPKVFVDERNESLRGWRLWINKNAKVVESNKGKEKVFDLPIRLVRGKYVSYFEIVHKSDDLLKKVYDYYWENKGDYKYELTFEEVRDEMKKEASLQEFNFSMIFFPALSKALNSSQNKPLPLLEANESELLYLQDFSKINLNVPSKLPANVNSYLEKMYLGDTKLDDIRLFTGLDELSRGEKPSKSGLVLYGLPGTGKTHLVEEGLVKVFRDELGFSFHSVEIGEVLSNHYVGGLAANISSKIFAPAIRKIVDTQKPCFVFVDEASDLLEKSKETESNNWRSQGVEAMKSFINPKRYPGIIICLATNLEEKKFDDALTRDGRLKGIEIPLPNKERCFGLWKSYLVPEVLFKEMPKSKFNQTMIDKIAEVSANNTNIAFMVSFCNDYYLRNRNKKIVFNDFFALYVKELKLRMEKEKNRQIHNTESNYALSPAEKVEKKSKVEKSFARQIHIIDSILDGKKVSFKEIVSKPFEKLFSGRGNIKEKYNSLQKNFNEWITFLQRSNGNLFDKDSISLINNVIEDLDFLIEKLYENKFFEFKEMLKLIKKHLTVILLVHKDDESVDLVSEQEVRELMATIEDLKRFDDLFNESEGNNSSILDLSGNQLQFR